MSIEMFVCGFMLVWVSVVITHALTIAYCTPIMNVVDVREIVRTPFEVMEYKDEFIIDDREMTMCDPNYLVEKHIYQSANRLFNSLPREAFELFEQTDYATLGRRYTMRIKILPPRKK